jgi:hypothetical protein
LQPAHYTAYQALSTVLGRQFHSHVLQLLATQLNALGTAAASGCVAMFRTTLQLPCEPHSSSTACHCCRQATLLPCHNGARKEASTRLALLQQAVVLPCLELLCHCYVSHTAHQPLAAAADKQLCCHST